MHTWCPDITRFPGPRYQAIVTAMAEDLEAGHLQRGARLPTHRELARRLGLTVSTVSRAYAEAERRGLTAGEVGRGTFLAPAGPEYQTFAIAEPGEQVGTLDLRLNVPPPVPLDDLIRGSFERLAHDPELGRFLGRMPHAGHSAYRAAGARWVAQRLPNVEAEQVLICSGIQHGIVVSLAATCEAGDLVVTEALTFPGLRAACSLLGLSLKGLAMDHEGLLPEAFEQACRSQKVRALYTIPTLHNPTTATMSQARREAIADIARHHDVMVVEDDVYGLLAPETPPPLCCLLPDHGFYLAGLSKAVGLGLRIAYLAVPVRLFEDAAAVIRASLFMVPPLMAHLASGWIHGGEALRICQRRRRECQQRQALVQEILGPVGALAGGAAPHAWWPLQGTGNSQALVEQAHRAGIELLPSSAFAAGREGTVPEAVRLCLGNVPNRNLLRQALLTLRDLQPPGHALD